jgi:MoaA/NifB/PqqE/SkfB family radical SAM enzyme
VRRSVVGRHPADTDRFARLEDVFFGAIRFRKLSLFRKLLGLRGIGCRALRSAYPRWRRRKKGLPAPMVIALSPTMRCNLSCEGCYALDYPREDELSLEAIDKVLASAEGMGVLLVVVTGGEPLLKEGILDVFRRHKRLIFLIVTNGMLLDAERASVMARAGNMVPVISTEGYRERTDSRRGEGVYDAVIEAMGHLDKQRSVFGFSVMVTRDNSEIVSSDQFVEEMIDRGCTLGYYTEYIPVGSGADWNLVLEDGQRRVFRSRILALRRSRPIILVHLPDDEYEPDGRCRAVTGGCVHINSQGYVEPCPFAHFASENVKDKSLEEILSSDFLTRLRSSEAVYRRGRIGCALIENMEIMKNVACATGGRPTTRPGRSASGVSGSRREESA